MTNEKSRFEDLPNELLTDIFKNLDARNLFRAFHNLNRRLNQILQSFQYLQLILHINPTNLLKSNEEIFPFYVHSLIVDPWMNFNLTLFPNLHRLRLACPLPKVLEQVKPELMPCLEYLSIIYQYTMYEMALLRDKIFSNRFPHLKSCELLEEKTLMTIPTWTQSPSINILQTELVDSVAYQTILAACPNLLFLKFSMYSSNGMPTDMFVHENLRRMIIEYRASDWFANDDDILSGFLVCVPNLEILHIHRRISCQNFEKHFEHYDWLASILAVRVLTLRKFHFVLHLLSDQKMFDEKSREQIEANFVHAHQGRYQALLKINRE